GTVEPLAQVIVGEDCLGSVFFDTGDATVAVLTQDEPPLGIHIEAVGAGFVARLAAACLGTGVAGRFEELGSAFAFLPLDDDVVWNVGKEQTLGGLVPDRPFRPDEPIGNLLKLGVLGNQLVETRIEPLDGADDLLPRVLFWLMGRCGP